MKRLSRGQALLGALIAFAAMTIHIRLSVIISLLDAEHYSMIGDLAWFIIFGVYAISLFIVAVRDIESD